MEQWYYVVYRSTDEDLCLKAEVMLGTSAQNVVDQFNFQLEGKIVQIALLTEQFGWKQ